LEVFPTLQCIRRVLEVVLCLVIGLNHFWNWQKSDQSNVAKMRKKTLDLRNHEALCNFASTQKIKLKQLKKGYMIFAKKINTNRYIGVHISKMKRDDLFMKQMMFFVVFSKFQIFSKDVQ